MLIYIFKSAACMAIFFVFYKFLLERENMHVFKRFYLLLAIGASLVIPALVFTEYVVVEPVEYTEVQQTTVSDYEYIGVPTALEKDVLDVEPILWTVYFLGFVFFGFRFIKNLFQIIRRIRKNPKQKSASFIQVLLKENFPPHTFFKYIFLNKKKLEANEIPKEVLLHEETHAREKHSLDVVLIEFLQVIFWFNPLIYLFIKAIKLNHEFLADQAVLDKDIDETTYQNTLLSYLSPDSEKKYQLKLANAINYSSIKKRFTVMKTHTSKKAVLMRSLLLLPLLAVLVLGFSQTELIEQESKTSQSIKKELENINNLQPNYLQIDGDWIEKENESSELSITKSDGGYIFNWRGSNSIKIKEDNGEYYHITPKGNRKFPLALDAQNRTLTYAKIEYIPLEKSLKGKLYGRWKNKEKDITFNVLHSGNEIVWDVIKADKKPVRYYPKKQGDRYAFTYGKDLPLWSFKVEDGVLYDSEGLVYQRISNRSVELAGLILDAETLKPLKSVEIYDNKGNRLSKTDERGYYKVQFDDLGEGEIRFEYTLNKKGYKPFMHKEHWGNLQGKVEMTYYFGLSKKESNTPEFSQNVPNNNLSYESIHSNLYLVQNQFEFNKKLSNAKKDNQDVLIEIDNEYYLVNDTGWIKINSTADLISVDGTKIMTASKLNSSLTRKEITGMTPLENSNALYGVYTIPGGIPKKSAKTKTNHSNTTPKQIAKYNSLAKKYNAIPIARRKIPLSDLKVLETIFRSMSKEQKANSQPFPECLPKNVQDGASRELMKEYNALAKKYNSVLAESKSIQIKKKDVERLEYIHGLMSEKQRADAEPFPDFPEPPPAPKAPKAPKEAKAPKVKKGEKSDIPPPPSASKLSDVAFAEKVIDETIANQDPYDYPSPMAAFSSPKVLDILHPPELLLAPKTGFYLGTDDTVVRIEVPRSPKVYGEVRDIIPPPAPPEPQSPLDHVIEMAKKGATFYYEDKKITSDKAIELLKKNKSLNIDSRGSKGNRPVVKISKAPIKIGYSSSKNHKSESNIELQKIELIAMRSNGELYRQKIGERLIYFSENFRNCSEYSFDGREISENEALDIYVRNEDIFITTKDSGNKGLKIKC